MNNQTSSMRFWTKTPYILHSVKLYAAFIIFLLVARNLYDNILTSIGILVFYPLYTAAEKYVQDAIDSITNSSLYFNSTPINLLIWAIVLIIFVILGVNFTYFFKKKRMDVVSTYLYCVLITLITFCFASAIKCVVLGIGLVNYKRVQRGFFGVLQRFFLLFRGVLVIPFWITYFNGAIIMPSLITLITQEKTPICYLYIVLKCSVLLWQLWDFGFSIYAYKSNGRAMCRPAPPEHLDDLCVICQFKVENPLQLMCGHTFCTECAIRWFAEHQTCPTCRHKIAERRVLDFGNGLVPTEVLLYAF